MTGCFKTAGAQEEAAAQSEERKAREEREIAAHACAMVACTIA